MCFSRALIFGATITPAQCDRPESSVVASPSTSSMRRWRFEAAICASIRARSSVGMAPTSISASTKKRRPCSVGTRPALVWGAKISPASSRSIITLRTEAGDRFCGRMREMVREPTGSPVSR